MKQFIKPKWAVLALWMIGWIIVYNTESDLFFSIMCIASIPIIIVLMTLGLGKYCSIAFIVLASGPAFGQIKLIDFENLMPRLETVTVSGNVHPIAGVHLFNGHLVCFDTVADSMGTQAHLFVNYHMEDSIVTRMEWNIDTLKYELDAPLLTTLPDKPLEVNYDSIKLSFLSEAAAEARLFSNLAMVVLWSDTYKRKFFAKDIQCYDRDEFVSGYTLYKYTIPGKGIDFCIMVNEEEVQLQWDDFKDKHRRKVVFVKGDRMGAELRKDVKYGSVTQVVFWQ